MNSHVRTCDCQMCGGIVGPRVYDGGVVRDSREGRLGVFSLIEIAKSFRFLSGLKVQSAKLDQGLRGRRFIRYLLETAEGCRAVFLCTLRKRAHIDRVHTVPINLKRLVRRVNRMA